MNISFLVEPYFQNDRIFSADDSAANRDDCLRPFIELRRWLAERGTRLATHDLLPIGNAETVLCLNMPPPRHDVWRQARRKGFPVHVIALESEYIHRGNANRALIDRCRTIFTYSDDLIDGDRFLPIRFSQTIRPPRMRDWGERRFACMVSGNKYIKHPTELYSKRLAVIRWYDVNNPGLFDLYGVGWDLPIPSSIPRRIIRKLPVLQRLAAPKFGVYRGTLSQKEEMLAGYRFCFCYENFSSPRGWVTEKIFDAMFAGCIPVYWGAENIADHVPSECFIDASKFNGPADLHEKLHSMSDLECKKILASIRSFLASDRVQDFSVETFVETLAKRLCERGVIS